MWQKNAAVSAKSSVGAKACRRNGICQIRSRIVPICNWLRLNRPARTARFRLARLTQNQGRWEIRETGVMRREAGPHTRIVTVSYCSETGQTGSSHDRLDWVGYGRPHRAAVGQLFALAHPAKPSSNGRFTGPCGHHEIDALRFEQRV